MRVVGKYVAEKERKRKRKTSPEGKGDIEELIRKPENCELRVDFTIPLLSTTYQFLSSKYTCICIDYYQLTITCNSAICLIQSITIYIYTCKYA